MLQAVRLEALRSVSLHQGEARHLGEEATAHAAIAGLEESYLLEEVAASEAINAVEELLERRSSAVGFGEGGSVQERGVTRVAAVGHRGASYGVRAPAPEVQLVFISVALLSFLACSCACLAIFARTPSDRHAVRMPLLEAEKSHSDRLSMERPSVWRWSDTQLALPESGRDDAGIASKESEQAGSSSEGGGQPAALMLCPQLLVPPGTRLDCVVGGHLCRRRQLKTFKVCGLTGVQLFQVRAEETDSDRPGICMETLERERLAFLSTEELWTGASSPQMSIFHAWGNKYGAVRKTEEGAFEVSAQGREEDNPVLKYIGDFAGNSYKVVGKGGRTIAVVSPSSEGVKKVVVHSRNDAGLVILGILAIDKCEMPADRVPSDQTAGLAA